MTTCLVASARPAAWPHLCARGGRLPVPSSPRTLRCADLHLHPRNHRHRHHRRCVNHVRTMDDRREMMASGGNPGVQLWISLRVTYAPLMHIDRWTGARSAARAGPMSQRRSAALTPSLVILPLSLSANPNRNPNRTKP